MPGFRKVKKGQEVGRTKLTDEIIAKIQNNLRAGNYTETAAILAGVKKATFYHWINKAHASKKENIYTRLLDAVEKGQAEAEARMLYNIDLCANGRKPEFLRDENGKLVLNDEGNPIFTQRGMDPDWKADAWRLERRFPKKWGAQTKVELTGSDGGPVKTATETDEEREERLKRIAEYQKHLKALDEPE